MKTMETGWSLRITLKVLKQLIKPDPQNRIVNRLYLLAAVFGGVQMGQGFAELARTGEGLDLSNPHLLVGTLLTCFGGFKLLSLFDWASNLRAAGQSK